MKEVNVLLIAIVFLVLSTGCSKSEERKRYEVFAGELMTLEQDMHEMQRRSAKMKEEALNRLPKGLYEGGEVVINRSEDSIKILDNENQRQGLGRALVYVLGGISNFFVHPDSVRQAQPLLTKDLKELAAVKRSHDGARVRQRALYVELHNINVTYEDVLTDNESEALLAAIDSIYSTPDHPMNYLAGATKDYTIGKLMDLTKIAECDYCDGTGVVVSDESGVFFEELYQCPRCGGTGCWGY